MPDEYLTVSQLNQYIKDVVNAGFPQLIWVCGEIQQYDRNKSKNHIFFELAEKDEMSKDIRARIGLVIFAGTKPSIAAALKLSENAFDLKDDIEVKFLCKVDFYPPHGAMRLIVEGIDPYYTLGKLAQGKQKLIAELEKKGVFEENKQLMIPEVPLNVGMISSFDSAAYNDFLDELKMSGIGFKVYFENALMQGANAEKDIVRAINKCAKLKQLDVLVITRGGGSLADLSCFDSQLIAETIAELKVPVLTGIGHEINISITDMTAHTFAKTPTAIAQFLVERINDYVQTLDDCLERVVRLAQECFSEADAHIKDQSHRLHTQTMSFLKGHNEHCVRLAQNIKVQAVSSLNARRQFLTNQSVFLKRAAVDLVKTNKLNLENCDKIINAYHPKNTLKRGFSIARTQEGKLIKDVKDIKKGEPMVTEILNGSIESIVQTTKK